MEKKINMDGGIAGNIMFEQLDTAWSALFCDKMSPSRIYVTWDYFN